MIRDYYSDYLWRYKTKEKVVFLTFDDGPTPEITDWVLAQLDRYQAKGSFFLIGQNVQRHPDIAHRVLDQGHAVGNHTFSHKDGWKTDNKLYLRDFLKGQKIIKEYTGYQTPYFRPPFTRISKSQAQHVMRSHQIIMMDVMSGDFDQSLNPEACYQNVMRNVKSGSIVLMHDSKQAWDRLQDFLPRILHDLNEQGYRFLSLDQMD